MCSLGNEPTTFALLTQCSTTEPQEHIHASHTQHIHTHTYTHTHTHTHTHTTFTNELITVFIFNCLHSKSLLVTYFLKAVTQTPEAHTKSAKPYTNSRPLTLSFQFHNTLFAKHNTILYATQTNLTGINIMAKVFANVSF